MIIGLNGYAGSGKDTVGKIIQYCKALDNVTDETTIKAMKKQGYLDQYDYSRMSGWEIKKFAEKVKIIASIMTGIPRHKFEDQDFKMSRLGEEWDGMRISSEVRNKCGER